MARARGAHPSARAGWRDRHGRGIRSAVTGPHLPLLSTRVDLFDITVASTADYLRELWPEELASVSFEVAALPSHVVGAKGLDRWLVKPAERRVILFRVPIERLAHLHRDDDLHRRMMVEGSVFRAAAEYLDRDPWDLGPERFRYF